MAKQISIISRILGRAAQRISFIFFGLARRVSHVPQEQDLVLFLRRELKKGDCIIDVGANEGQFAQLVVDEVPDARLLCVEPIPKNVEILRSRFTGREILIEQSAAGAKASDGVEFLVHPYSQASSLLPLTATARTAFRSLDQPMERILVPQYTLDDILDRHHWVQHVDLLKIDVEGFEAQVLHGAKRTLERCRWLLVETQVKRMNVGACLFDEVCQIAREQGFTLHSVVGQIHDVFGELLLMDLLFQNGSLERTTCHAS